MVGARADVQDALPSDAGGWAASSSIQEHEDGELVPLRRKLVIDLVLSLGNSEFVPSALVAARLIVPLSHMFA